MSFEWPLRAGRAGDRAARAGRATCSCSGGARRYAVRFTNLDLLANVVTEYASLAPPPAAGAALLALAALVVGGRPSARRRSTCRRNARRSMLDHRRLGLDAGDGRQPDRMTAARDAAKPFSERLPKRVQARAGAASTRRRSWLFRRSKDRGLVQQATGRAQRRWRHGDGRRARALAHDAARARAKEPRPTAGRRSGTRRRGGRAALRRQEHPGGADPLQVAREAKKLGIPINTVALGTDRERSR